MAFPPCCKSIPSASCAYIFVMDGLKVTVLWWGPKCCYSSHCILPQSYRVLVHDYLLSCNASTAFIKLSLRWGIFHKMSAIWLWATLLRRGEIAIMTALCNRCFMSEKWKRCRNDVQGPYTNTVAVFLPEILQHCNALPWRSYQNVENNRCPSAFYRDASVAGNPTVPTLVCYNSICQRTLWDRALP